jgi:peptide chain release factor-like protein
MHPAAVELEHLLADCDIRRTRRSGPGGQHRNKVETAVVVRHRPSGVVASASERRSQAENLRQAMIRLRVNLALDIRCPRNLDAAPSLIWRSRCHDGRIVVSPRHSEFPALLAETLDVLATHDWDTRSAAEALGCSASQLTKLLKAEPRAMKQVNDRRVHLGLHPLR